MNTFIFFLNVYYTLLDLSDINVITISTNIRRERVSQFVLPHHAVTH